MEKKLWNNLAINMNIVSYYREVINNILIKEISLKKDDIKKNIGDDNLQFLCELKFDGVSINLTYKNGRLIKAVTRGDGIEGDDVTENIKTIKTIPLKLKGFYPQNFQIRGEIIIEKNELKIEHNLT